MTKYETLCKITDDLKNLSKQYNAPIIMAVQDQGINGCTVISDDPTAQRHIMSTLDYSRWIDIRIVHNRNGG